MNKRREMHERLARRDIVTGCSVDQPSVALAGMLGRQGFDLVFIDTEHGGPGIERVGDLATGARAGNALAVLRPWSRDPGLLRRYVDCGIDGLIIPDLAGVDDLKSLLSTLDDAVPSGHADLVLIGLIESVGAIDMLPGLFAEPRLDAVLVGPGDLAVSMGLPRGSRDPAITQRVLDVLRLAEQAGRSAGAPVFRIELSLILGAGGNLLMYSSDRLLLDGIAAAQADIKASVADSRSAGDASG
jgi:4-hydroxy-2-oxoheptanedioate aldolase